MNQETNWLVDEGVFRKQPSRFGANKNMPRRAYQSSGHFKVKLETNGKVSYEVAYATVLSADFVFDRWQAHATA
ncbi:hypothetical protein AB0I02_29475 [Streptomyces phaeochromogenes]